MVAVAQVKCACDGPLICLECRAEIARRVAGEGERGWTWTVEGIKAMWAAMDEAKRKAAVVPTAADEDDSFGWSPE